MLSADKNKGEDIDCCSATVFSGFLSSLSLAMYSSTITWAFAPPKPNEFTPINNGFSDSSNSVKAVTTDNLSPSKSICGLGFSKCKDGGIALFFKLKITFKSPAIPEAVSKCPRFVLAEPIGNGFLRGLPNTLANAPASKGSPTTVPVPCASK